jgi:DNA-directed RNA polymerase specialized sigma subunit
MATSEEAARLTEQFWPLAMGLAREWSRKHPSMEMEFSSSAGVALWRAARYYDPARGFKFVTLALVAIRRELDRFRV